VKSFLLIQEEEEREENGRKTEELLFECAWTPQHQTLQKNCLKKGKNYIFNVYKKKYENILISSMKNPFII
jgi:hypothetical protein